MLGRYPEGSDADRAHKLLRQHDVKVDHVYGVDVLEDGQREITFTFDGNAHTAFVKGRAHRARHGGLGRAPVQARRQPARRPLTRPSEVGGVQRVTAHGRGQPRRRSTGLRHRARGDDSPVARGLDDEVVAREVRGAQAA